MWTWDITWIPSVVRGRWYYLFLVEDVFSRKITEAEVCSEHHKAEQLWCAESEK
ncbi:hypothetical protein [Serratia sp. DD3]|uniref:hypothetical protein n=1 Tax=Serratia sp. DD3 TaxID=1410619 RepID=UPI00135F1BFF